MHRIVACIVVMGMVAGIGSRAFAQEADPAHAEYRRAAHKAANHAVGALIESGRWNAESGGPGLAMVGGGKCVVCPCISCISASDTGGNAQIILRNNGALEARGEMIDTQLGDIDILDP